MLNLFLSFWEYGFQNQVFAAGNKERTTCQALELLLGERDYPLTVSDHAKKGCEQLHGD